MIANARARFRGFSVTVNRKRRAETAPLIGAGPTLFDLMVGESSAAIRLSSTVELTGEVRTLDRDWRMTSRHKIEPLRT
jgi:hypothetical protein